MSFRISTFKIDGKPVKTPEGFLKVDAVVTRSGVFKYRNVDGSERLEYRSEGEVFKKESFTTLSMIPVTNDHPASCIVTADNAKSLQVGFTGETVTPEKPFVKVKAVITDKNAIADVEAGKRELSCGYFCDVEEHAGTANGEAYTHVQKNIRYNHVAIVYSGRAGHDVKLKMDELHLDGEDTDFAYMVSTNTDAKDNKNTTINKGGKMPCKVINGISYESAQEVINHCDALEKQVAELTGRFSALEAERDAQKARADKSECVIATFDQKVNDAVKARRELEAKASKVLPKDTKIDSMTDEQIRSAVIGTKYPSISLDGKDVNYVNALFDAAFEAVQVNPALVNNQVTGDAFKGDSSVNEDADPLLVRARF